MSFDWNPSLNNDDLAGLLGETSPVGNAQQSSDQSNLRSTTVPPLQVNGHGPTFGFAGSTGFGLDPLLQDDFHFNDTYGGNDYYLLNNLEALDPFGAPPGTNLKLDSLPEPTSACDLKCHTIPPVNENFFSTSLPTMALSVESSTSSAKASPLLPDSKPPSINNMQSGLNTPDARIENFLNNLMFLKSPMPPTSTTSGPSLDTATEGADLVSETLKRQRGTEPDVLTACWTSPLCPSNKRDGTPPDPANCGGACAPFLFGDQPLPGSIDDTSLLAQEVQIPDSVESPTNRSRPNLKRSESESSASVGRKFSTNKSPSADSAVETIHEKSPSTEATATDTKNESKASKSRTRLPHNQVERRYRESLNTQLESLRRVVPSLQNSRSPICDGADIEDMSAPTKPSKALVLASATAYIKQIEKEKRQLAEDNAALKLRVKALQSLVKCENCSLLQVFMDMKLQNQS